MKYYKLDIGSLKDKLDTDLHSGLSDAQASARLDELVRDNKTSNADKNTFYNGFSKTLLFAVISAAVYFAAAVFNKNFSYCYYAFAALCIVFTTLLLWYFYTYGILRATSVDDVNTHYALKVIRGSKEVFVKYSDIVYGDVVIIRKGDYIPFDGCIIESSSFTVDESGITSKNTPVDKHAGIITDDNIGADELYNTVFCGSYALSGNAKVLVTDVGRRVYISKIHRKKHHNTKTSIRVSDFSKIIILLFNVLASIFTAVCTIISGDYILLTSIIPMIIAIFFSDFFSKFILVSFKLARHRLHKKNIIIKSFNDIDKLNSADILFVNKSHIFDDKCEITGFSSLNNEFTSVANVQKNNFGVFLYSAFSTVDTDTPFKQSVCKILKKVGIDYNEITGICPVISHFYDNERDCEICGRIYDGNKMLIVSGDYHTVFSMCGISETDFPCETFKRMSESSTEILAVASKKVDIIPDDLSSESAGYTLFGLIGVNRKLSRSAMKMCESLETRGVHCVILFPGNGFSATSVYGKERTNSCSFADADGLDKESLSKVNIIYDYSGNISVLAEKAVQLGFHPAYCGDRIENDKKTVTFKSADSTAYSNYKADVVSNGDFASVYYALSEADNAFTYINNALETIISFIMFYIVCGVFFSILTKTFLFNLPLLTFIAFFVIPLTSFCRLYKKDIVPKCNNKIFSMEPIQRMNLINSMLVTIIFFVVTVILIYTVTIPCAIGILSLAFCVFLAGYPVKHSLLAEAVSYIPSVIMLVLFLLPVSSIFGVSGFIPLSALIAVILGVISQFAVKYIGVLIAK